MGLGAGIGLRTKHYAEFLAGTPKVDWVEAISENYMGLGGRPLAVLMQVRRDRPVVLHGVSLAIGSAAPLDALYMQELKTLADKIEPVFVSDHLCWGRAHGKYAHDLLPLPFTEEAVRHIVGRVNEIQDYLKRPLVLENVSSYMAFKESQYTEWEFVNEIARRSGCGVLLDVNNVFVSAHNHGFAPKQYIDGINVEFVKQFHLAGHEDRGAVILDTHEGHVSGPVWDLFRYAVRRFGDVPSLIEWDEGVPDLDVLIAEATQAKTVAQAELTRVEKSPVVPKPVTPAPLTSNLVPTFDKVLSWIIVPGTEAEGADALVHGGALTPKDRVGIYAEMYWLRIRDALREEFPHIIKVIGVERFDGLMSRYLAATPSEHFSLGEVGARLAAYLERNEPNFQPPWVIDMVKLERAREEVFVAPDEPTMSLEELAQFTSAFSTTGLKPVSALRVVSLGHDVVSDYGQLGDEVEKRDCVAVVWRQGFEVFHVEIPADEAEALRRAADGSVLFEICDAFAERENPAAAAHEAIASWLNEGMIQKATPASA